MATKKQPNSTEELHRNFQLIIDPEAVESRSWIDEEARTVELCFSTETEEVERWFGIEKLDHSPGAVDLTRLREAGPLLMGHDSRDQIGCVVEARLDSDRKCRAKVRFSKSARGEEIFQDVIDRIRKNISVGYVRHETVLFEERENGPDVYLVKRWEPFEVTFASIPWDIDAQVGRERKQNTVEEPQKEERQKEMADKPEVETKVDLDKVRAEAQAAERQRMSGIRSVAAGVAHLFDATELVRQFEDNGKPASEFQAAVLERMQDVKQSVVGAQEPEEDAKIGMTEKEIRDYSIVNVVTAQLTGDWSKAGFERAASEAVAEKLGKKPEGAFLPYDVLAFGFGKRDLSSTSGGGANLIGTDHMAGSMIHLMRNESIVCGLGATMIPGLVSDIDIPKQIGANAGAWIDNESYSDSDETNAVFSAVNLSPKTMRIRTDLTRKMLKQSTPAIEAMIREDIAFVSAEMIDKAGIHGSGTGAEPQGIIGATGVNVIAIGADGGPITHSHLVDMKTALKNHKRLGTLAYVGSSELAGHLQKTPIHSAGSILGFLMDNAGKVCGHQCLESNTMPDDLTKGAGTNLSALIYGAWKALLIGLWGGLDIEADKTTLGDRGGLVLRAFQDIDIKLRYPGAFSTIVDATT